MNPATKPLCFYQCLCIGDIKKDSVREQAKLSRFQRLLEPLTEQFMFSCPEKEEKGPGLWEDPV